MQLELLGAIAEEWVKMKLFYTANLLVTDYDSKVLLGKYFKGDFKDFNSNLIKETGYKDLIKNLLLFIGIGSLELKSNQKKLYTKAFSFEL